jgi:DNA-binding transcriptional LysR family regulator
MYDSYVESQTAVDQYLLSAPLTLHFGTVVPIAVDSCHIQAMRACEKIYPDCSFQLTEFDNWILKEMLRDNNMEFILAYQEQTGQNSFVSIPVQDDRLTAMVSTRHPYYHLDELSLDMLADQNIITSPRHSYIGNLVYNICRAANFTPHVWYSDNTNCDLANIIDHGGGIGLMMQSAANLLAGPHTKLIPLSCVQVQQLCIFYLKEHKLSPVAQLYLEELQRAIKQQQFFTVK